MSLPHESIDFAQEHVRILSGLYGLLRPLDSIRPYRLEMGTRWAPKAKNLYGYWGDRIAAMIAQEMAELGTDVLVNLASNEYWRAARSEEQTSELQYLMRNAYDAFCLKKKKTQ